VSREHIAAQIESFVRIRFQVSPADRAFSRDVNLWEDGYVDSMGVVEMIQFLETTFDVVIPADALFAPEFTTISGIAGRVAALQDHAGGAERFETAS
jgi:acyl carrier protein